MIVFDLQCEQGHRFEGWFGSSSDYTDQAERGMLACPECGTDAIAKAPMAPSIAPKGTFADRSPQETADADASTPGAAQGTSASGARSDGSPGTANQAKELSNQPVPAEVSRALAQLAKAQKRALKDSTWVGNEFAERSRAMHYGEREHAPIHGQATVEEAKALVEDGVAVAPLPFRVTPPEKLN